MMLKNLVQLVAVLPLALAAPTTQDDQGNSGELTYFNPGLGACGKTNGRNDLITAVSAELYDSSKPCGRSIQVKGPAGSVTVEVVDRCVGCARNDLDLSPAAFKKAAGGLGVGRAEGHWDWA